MKRSSGILMPLSALPSPYGIGTVGKEAYAFVDFLADAQQTWWQILPVGPTSFGDSPYQSPSAYAGNPYLIDLDLLIEEELLTKKEVQAVSWGENAAQIDYGLLYQNRLPVLQKAVDRLWKREEETVRRFEAEQASWLSDYALFMALKRHFDMRPWQEWPDSAARLHQEDALQIYRKTLETEIRFFVGLQTLFFQQWAALRTYAHEKGILLLGDLPLYVALDSADVWASPENFLLDEENIPIEVAGVPPDYFSKEGQLWGNPLYDYEAMEQDGFGWWIRRIGGAEKRYDAVRIDHFRGWESYWAVPYAEKTAKAGHWVKGPGMKLIRVLKDWFPQIQFIAEDLGAPSPEVTQLLEESTFPGMKVLEFAFDAKEESTYLPHAYSSHCVCYTGTHDNEPLQGWLTHAKKADLAKAKQYLGLHTQEGFCWGVLRGGMSSVADLFIAQMQDYLELGSEARMNTPGTAEGNWRWRMLPGQADQKLAQRIAEMTILYGRNRASL